MFAVGAASPFFSPGYFVPVEDADLRVQRDRQLVAVPEPLRRRRLGAGLLAGATPTYAYFVKATHSKALAFISYGPAIPSSYDACQHGGHATRRPPA